MGKATMDTSQKVVTCLDYIDQRLEDTSEQTIQIAEMIIDDIKELTAGYPQALRDNRLQDHADKVRDTQMKWVNQLQDIILEQTQRDLNGQVIQALQKFAQNLNDKQNKHLDFELPSVVQRRDANLAHEYLTQEEIELLMASDALPANQVHH
ncbi:MAG: hypothetical protein RI556_00270 [Hydrogenovibrio sp.]|uniref:hypothetical protein n=1 Tax=Hydrogenovibrio sp. TaxID=2065821 RepID=UPI00286FAFE2|nr:hypothetical protein [Hydrogenovibrio sp.]MDR9497588.1 hypothetical protein [Hydrogenovibrio sp.]